MLCFYHCSNWITKIYLSGLVLLFWENWTEISSTSDCNKIFYIFHVFFISFCVPKNNTEFNSVTFLESKNQSAVRQITPLVIGSNQSTINIGTSCHCYSESTTIPWEISDSFIIWYFQISKMVSFIIKEFDNSSFFFKLKGASSSCQDSPSRIPRYFLQYHGSINGIGIIIFVIPHKNNPALLIGNSKCSRPLPREHISLPKPLNARKFKPRCSNTLATYNIMESSK